MANILIVDDEKNIRDGLKKGLQHLGYDIFLAEDGKDGEIKFMSHKIDLVVTDIKMPNQSGMDLLKKIITFDNNIPVIILTGHGTIEMAVESIQNGAYDFLIKPIDLNKLEIIVNRALKQRNLIA